MLYNITSYNVMFKNFGTFYEIYFMNAANHAHLNWYIK